ncbi:MULTISPECIES: HAD family hydrolase [Prochlorococcus]|uniref:HAD family hydrolase n=1 Tax=Prochlorococcus TaxID=1218 RepID=UPI0005338C47|nr:MULTISPECIES: HAD-IA family hydrolase [Prochlorococcus]KGG13044.1 Haloacid dehalogenase/epoxide hydrolase family protein [Prochlorococcus sp. MIT 0601]
MPQLLLRGEPLGVVKGILFDKDGTLVNSEKRLNRLGKMRINQAVRLYQSQKKPLEKILELSKFLNLIYGINSQGIDPTSSLAIASRKDNLISTATIFSLIGETWPNSLQFANQIFKSADKAINEIFSEDYSDQILPGVLEILQILKRKNISLALISNDTKTGLIAFLKKNKLEKTFTGLWSSDDLPKKPNPLAVSNLCKTLKLEAQECALVGDADTDLFMAKQSKVKIVLGYTAGWSQKPLLYEYDHLIHHWDELNIQ